MILYSDILRAVHHKEPGMRKRGVDEQVMGSHSARLREDAMTDQRLMSSVAVSEDSARLGTLNAGIVAVRISR